MLFFASLSIYLSIRDLTSVNIHGLPYKLCMLLSFTMSYLLLERTFNISSSFTRAQNQYRYSIAYGRKLFSVLV